jgi:hypothetical protein
MLQKKYRRLGAFVGVNQVDLKLQQKMVLLFLMLPIPIQDRLLN